MLTLAEIADKMPTILSMWCGGATFAIILAAVAMTHRLAAVIAVALALASSCVSAYAAYHEAYLEGSFSVEIWDELGRCWVIHSFASALLPFVPVVFVAAARWRRDLRRGRIKRGLCPHCKYPVGTSPVCTECGKPVKPKSAEAAA